MALKNFPILYFLIVFTISVEAQPMLPKDSLLAHVAELASDEYQGREVEQKGNRKAAEYILKRFEAIGLKTFEDSYVHSFPFYNRFTRKAYQGRNLIGYLPGTKYAKQYIVLSAHYDHVGIKKGEIYNGADDNASGVGALIEIARYIQANPLEFSLIIVAFDAEEVGLRGADAFTEEPPVPLDSILININLDMISRNTNEEIYICGTSYTPALRPPLERLAEAAPIKVSFGHEAPEAKGANDWTNASDHGKFHQKGIPFLYFGVEDHADYHQPTDDFNRIMPDFYHQVAELVLRAVQEFGSGKSVIGNSK